MEKKQRRKKEQAEFYFDYSLLFIVLFLIGFGLVMIYSASSYTATSEFGDPAHFLKNQLAAAILGLIAMGIMAFVPQKWIAKSALFAYFASAILIVLVLSPLGVESHKARRWIRLPGIPFNLQPAEIAKLAVIILLAVVISKMGKKVSTWKGFGLIMAIPIPLAAMIYVITDNLSSAIIVMAIAAAMVFVASRDYKKFIVLGLVAIACAAGAVYIIKAGIFGGGFRGGRILAWLDPESYAKDQGFQTLQALYAIGSGGVWGKGLGQSMQKLSFIPESQNDMIFSIICEELGMFGAIAIILMFVLLIWRMMIIANNAPNLFSAMLVVGVIGHIAVQAVLNIAVVTNTIPNTGISLPFISYGGSSILFLLIEIGLVFNVARNIQLKEM